MMQPLVLGARARLRDRGQMNRKGASGRSARPREKVYLQLCSPRKTINLASSDPAIGAQVWARKSPVRIV